MGHLYVLYSEKLDKYFIGTTYGEIEDNLKRHNTGGNHLTANGIPWEIHWYEELSYGPDRVSMHDLRQMSRSKLLRFLKKRKGRG
ncbi:MAG: hypothetical protein AAF361_15705 [Bacteroidota bacterium]